MGGAWRLVYSFRKGEVVMSRKVLLLAVSVVLLPAVVVFLEVLGTGAPPEKPLDAAKPAAKAAPAAAPKPLVGGERAILKALKEPTSLEFVESPLEEVVDYLQQKHGIPIVFDRIELSNMGIDPDTSPVTRHLSGISLGSALDLILDNLQLKWVIDRGDLLITSATRADSEEFLVTKVYDVFDLVVPVGAPDYPYWHGSLPCSHPDEDPHVRVPFGVQRARYGDFDWDSLIDLIKQTVEPNSWGSSGGQSDIAAFDVSLVISQTRRVHSEIAALLADLRAKRQQATPTVVVDLQWLWLDAGSYQQLVGGRATAAGRIQLAVDAKVLDQVARKAPGFRGRIMCVNGQLVHLASGDRRSVIAGATPTVEVKALGAQGGMMGSSGPSGLGGMGGFFAVPDSAGPSAPAAPAAPPAVNVQAPPAAAPLLVGQTAYQPVIDVPNVGVVVEVRPSVAPGASTAVLDLRSTVTRWLKPSPPAQIGSAGVAACPVDRPNMPAAEMAMTARVPLGKPVLLGAVTFAPADGAGLEKPTENPVQLCLIATTSIAADAEKPAKEKPNHKGTKTQR
jgi:hypothetical protein